LQLRLEVNAVNADMFFGKFYGLLAAVSPDYQEVRRLYID